MANIKQALTKEKPALLFLLKLLILLCLVKTIFLIYNYSFFGDWGNQPFAMASKVVAWSIYYDAVMACMVALPMLIATLLKPLQQFLLWISVILIVALFFLNCVDIFYFPFHRQRADNDLLYVLRNPFSYGKVMVLMLIAGMVLFIFFTSKYFLKSGNSVLKKLSSYKPLFTLALSVVIIASLFFNRGKRLLPTAALVNVQAEQLPLTQNSFHTFFYSLYRNREYKLPAHLFMTQQAQQQYFSIYKQPTHVADTPKNIVLFIMESVPFEFFDTANSLKPSLPFFDSLLQHSTFYNNAFSFSYTSNKGITAILSGLPTIIDIPLYHSQYTGIPKTAIGKKLAAKGYHSSFYVGDNYDDFGFAKCVNWLGFQQYNSMEKVKGYKQLEKHSMGLHDEYMLGYMQQQMQQQMQQTKQPFFQCFYNISTHYPNDLPEYFKKKTAALNIPAPHKSMMYYDECLANFFEKIKSQPWFSNTVFIFCSDHWASPSNAHDEDGINSFRIPIIVYEPSANKKEMQSNYVSQFDIMNTVMAYAGIKDSIISYGNSLTDARLFPNRTVFTKKNEAVYQAINSQYALGINADNGEILYCYQYKTDKEKKYNLWPSKDTAILKLANELKAFLQTAYEQYKNK